MKTSPPANVGQSETNMDKMMSSKKPSVVITTYCENKLAAQPNLLQSQNNNNNNLAAESSKSEFSTEFFGNCRPFKTKNRILLDLSKIRGPTGSVRGHKDVVRKSLEVIKVSSRRNSASSSTSTSSFSSSSSFSSFWSPSSSQLNSLSTFVSPHNRTTSSWTDKLTCIQQLDQNYCDEYLEQLYEEEQNRCVLYTTTLGVIRRTFEDSKSIKLVYQDSNLI